MKDCEINKNQETSCSSCENVSKHDMLAEQLAIAEKQILYLRADVENVRKNALREMHLQVQKNSLRIINEFLTIYEDFQRCADVVQSSSDITLQTGFSMVTKTMSKVFEDLGITVVGDLGIFNPEIHEAISHVPVSEQFSEGMIVSVVRPGFLYQGKLIRPAQVVVAA